MTEKPARRFFSFKIRRRLLYLVVAPTLAFLVLLVFLADVAPSDKAVTLFRMRAIEHFILRYAHTNDRLPVALSELLNFLPRPDDLRDGWGRPIEYEVGPDAMIILRSFGQDGVAGGRKDAADIIHKFSAKTPDGGWADIQFE